MERSTPSAGRLAGAVFHLGQLTMVSGVAVFHAQLVAPDRYDLLRSPRLGWWIVVASVLALSGYGLGLPELPSRRSSVAIRGVGSAGSAVAAVSLSQLALAQPLLPRSSLGLLLLLVPLWGLVGWNLAADLANWRGQRDRVFVVAARQSDVAALGQDLVRQPELPAVLVGSMTVDAAETDGADPQDLVAAVEAAGATVLVLDTAAQSEDRIVAQAAELHGRGVRIRTLALFYEAWLGKLPVADLARVSLLFDIGELHRASYVRAKRIVDVALGLAGLPVLAAAAPLIWVGNRFANRGPLLFRQERVGKDGRVFTIYKFRTMAPGEPVAGPAPWTVEADPRITRLGGFLRRSHLDELPQLVNVLRGELSVVGPRPEQPGYVAELSGKIPFYDVRHLVRPGLTGWAQVKQGYAAGTGDSLEKLQYDIYYLRRQGLALDARVIWRTLRGLIGGDGR